MSRGEVALRRALLTLCLSFLFLIEETVSQRPSLQPTSRVTTAPTPAPQPFDATIGTAFAPTTPGGACLNEQDYLLWTTPSPSGKNGFDLFPVDLQMCSERCAALLQLGTSVEYNCGGFARPACPPNLYAICVADCIARRPPLVSLPDFPLLQTPRAYSLPCATCMGNVSSCVTESCFSECVFGNENPPCKRCSQVHCNPGFERCAGLNIDQKQDPPPDFSKITIGATTGGIGLLLSVAFLGYRYRLKTRRHRNLSVNELAKMADMQSRSTPGGAKTRNAGLGLDNGITKAKKLRTAALSSLSSGSKQQKNALVPEVEFKLTPYQQEYEAQQRANARAANFPHPRPAPSARMSVRAKEPVDEQMMNRGGVPLVMLWTFRGERPDELSLEIGTRLVGLEQADGWWLAQTKDGRIGLVPATYTAHEAPSTKKSALSTHKRVEPSMRVSKMRKSVASNQRHMMDMPVTPLIGLYEFKAAHPDEFHLREGAIVFGLLEQDGWTLVRDESGTQVGLVPTNHVERILAVSAPPMPLANPSASTWLDKEPEF